jgi:Na+/proline symporter
VQRYVTTSSEKEAAKSLWMNIVMVLVGSAIFFALGTALFVFYQENPELMDPTLPAKDSVLPFFIMQNLPVGVAGLIIAGVFAAAQSTISSSLNSVATAFVTDVYGRLLKPESLDDQRLGIAKWVVVILGVVGIGISCVLAKMGTDGVFMLFNRFIGFALGPLGGLFALGIFSRRPNGLAGLVALISGVLTVTVTYFLNEAGVIDLMPLLYGAVGFLTTLGTGVVLGFWLRASDEDVSGLTIWTQKK